MRMWLCDPEMLCQKHLCGEHLEMHMFVGALKKGNKIAGYLENNLFEPKALFTRHEALKQEMLCRGYNHQSEMEDEPWIIEQLSEEEQNWKVDRWKALKDLLSRCPSCRARLMEVISNVVMQG